MKPFRHAALQSADARGVTVILDAGWQARVSLVAAGIGRVLLLPPGGLREPRSWAVLDGQARDAWQGTERAQLFSAAPAATLTQDAGQITLAGAQLRVGVLEAQTSPRADSSSLR